jgi:hypothetical protein
MLTTETRRRILREPEPESHQTKPQVKPRRTRRVRSPAELEALRQEVDAAVEAFFAAVNAEGGQ